MDSGKKLDFYWCEFPGKPAGSGVRRKGSGTEYCIKQCQINMDKLADLFYNFYNELFCTDMSNKYVKKIRRNKKESMGAC